MIIMRPDLSVRGGRRISRQRARSATIDLVERRATMLLSICSDSTSSMGGSDSWPLWSHSNSDSRATGRPQNVEFVGEPGLSESGTSSSSMMPPMVEIDFQHLRAPKPWSSPGVELVAELGASSTTSGSTGLPKYELDFNQAERQKGVGTSKQYSGTTRDAVTISKLEPRRQGVEVEVACADTATAEDEETSEEFRAELEGAAERHWSSYRIVSQPFKKRSQPGMVFGKLSAMAADVYETTLAVSLSSPALPDMLENTQSYRAIARRCSCELVLTRRVIVKRTGMWSRYLILILRGPTEAALKKVRAQLDAANPAFRLAVPYEPAKPRPRLLASEHQPDNLKMAACAERTGRSAAAWDKVPLDMPQRAYAPLVGKPKNVYLPNNRAIEPVFSYVYPNWGVQTSKPIPHDRIFESAVDAAEELGKQQNKTMPRKGT